jgi:hypothetical protein
MQVLDWGVFGRLIRSREIAKFSVILLWEIFACEISSTKVSKQASSKNSISEC